MKKNLETLDLVDNNYRSIYLTYTSTRKIIYDEI